MDKTKLDKDQRRSILNSIQHWNNGITPNGQLAPDSCFVHNSVPSIVMKNLAEKVIPTSTKSEWTENLLQSGVLNPYDSTTQESLLLCEIIFKDDPQFIKLEARNKSVIRYIQRSPKAYVKVDDIARLTTEFTDELNKAEEHWPRNPMESRDMLHSIWNRYGFLWPEKIYIGYDNSPIQLLGKDDPMYSSLNPTSREESQDRAQHSPKAFSVVFRSNLRPLYEFFPPEHASKKKFVLEVIYHFSPSLLTNKPTLKSSSRHFASGELVQHPVTNAISSRQGSSLCLNEKWRLSADSSNTSAVKSREINGTASDRNGAKFCNSDNGGMLLNPEFSNLCTDTRQFTPQGLSLYTNKKPTGSTSTAKSPFSIISFDDKFNFSPGERSESNSTQITSIGSNSTSSSFVTKNLTTDYPTRALDTPVPLKGILLQSRVPDEKTDSDSHLKKNLISKNKESQLETVIEEAEKSSTSASNNSTMTYNDNGMHSSNSTKNDLKHSKFTTFQPNNPILISSFVPAPANNFDLSQGLIEKATDLPDAQPVSQWLDGNAKLFSLPKSNTVNSIYMPSNVIQSNTSSQYAETIKSIPSEEYVNQPMPILSKKQEKQPMNKFQAHYEQHGSTGDESDADDWTPSPSPSPTKGTFAVNLEKSTSPPALTEAETFKREVQQTYGTKDNAYNTIYKNIFLSTPTSNTTSQIRYFDDADDNASETDILRFQGGSSQLRPYTMTPRSRYSQQTRSSSANLAAEEYMLRKKSRELSFMMLVPPETKQQLLVRAMKQSTLSHWLQSLSENAKKLNRSPKVDATPTLSATSTVNKDINGSLSLGEIRLHHFGSHNRTIKKKKGFYHQKSSNRRQRGITL